MSRYQKGKTNLDFTEARDSEWQWHQLGHMQVCTSLQTDNHASTPPLKCGRETVRQKPTGGSNEARTVSCPAFSSTKCVMTGGSGGGGDGGSGFDEMRDLGARVGTSGEWRVAGGGSVLPFNDAVSKSHCTSTSSAYT